MNILGHALVGAACELDTLGAYPAQLAQRARYTEIGAAAPDGTAAISPFTRTQERTR